MLFQQEKPKKEESEATAMNPGTSGAKLTNLKTTKPVTQPKTDIEKETNQSMEDLSEQVKGLAATLKTLIQMEKRKYPNYVKTYTLTNTVQSKLNFGIDTNNNPVLKVKIIGTGAGLVLGFNTDDMQSVISGESYEGEFTSIDYQVVSGKAYIQIYARIDK